MRHLLQYIALLLLPGLRLALCLCAPHQGRSMQGGVGTLPEAHQVMNKRPHISPLATADEVLEVLTRAPSLSESGEARLTVNSDTSTLLGSLFTSTPARAISYIFLPPTLRAEKMGGTCTVRVSLHATSLQHIRTATECWSRPTGSPTGSRVRPTRLHPSYLLQLPCEVLCGCILKALIGDVLPGRCFRHSSLSVV